MALVLLGSTTAIGQVLGVDDFKEYDDGAYISRYNNILDAVHKYNYVLDNNGSDTTNKHYDVMVNPIDFSYIKKDNNRVIVCMLYRVGTEYDLFFREIENEDTELFTVEDQNGNEVLLKHKKGHR